MNSQLEDENHRSRPFEVFSAKNQTSRRQNSNRIDLQLNQSLADLDDSRSLKTVVSCHLAERLILEVKTNQIKNRRYCIVNCNAITHFGVTTKQVGEVEGSYLLP